MGEIFDLDPADDLAELEARLNALFAYTARADVDPQLCMVSLDILQSIRAAIADYRIHDWSPITSLPLRPECRESAARGRAPAPIAPAGSSTH